jgi:hypothetical protein
MKTVEADRKSNSRWRRHIPSKRRALFEEYSVTTLKTVILICIADSRRSSVIRIGKHNRSLKVAVQGPDLMNHPSYKQKI